MKHLAKRCLCVALMLMPVLAHGAALQRSSDVVVRCSFAEAGHGVTAINDGLTGTSNAYWSSYRGAEATAEMDFVEYSWSVRCNITRVTVNWKIDDERLELPTEAWLAVWDGHDWRKAVDLTEANSAGNCIMSGLALSTSRLRLYMRSGAGCGIREFVVTGTATTDCLPATLTDNLKVTIQKGESATLAPALSLPDGEEETPNWYWLDDMGDVVSTEPTCTVSESGFYTVCYERLCGAIASLRYVVSIDGEYNPLIGYQWPSYSPTLDYDFRTEYPSLPAPTKGCLPENVGVAREVHGEWWSVAVGPNANPLISDTSMVLLAKKMDEDFAYFRDEMGWPPDKRARNGYYSQVYGYGSGLSFDYGTPNTATGGWQSTTYYNGSSWPMVFLSYYPIYSFDPSCTYGDRIGQQNACVHEGIHATFADLEGCRNSAWFHEGGNTWLQGEAEVRKSGKAPESMGFLSAGNMIAPFMPIECYSGWLQDDSFGGPSAEGVNMYNGSTQICTWRNLLGGVQYGELFPHFCSEILGKGSIPWIWRYCKNRVLQGMAEGITENGKKIPGLGDKQIRRLITEYRARQAMLDVGMWSQACEALLDGNWLVTIHQEWEPYWIKTVDWRATPYAKMTAIANADSTGWWKPEYRTTPGWSGANQVVLHTSGRAGDEVSIIVKPFTANMVCQLCYRTADGKVFYGEPVQLRRLRNTEVSMYMPEAPANGVVIAVITNTDYIYESDVTRKTHHNYHIKLEQNVWQPAATNYKWYKYAEDIKDATFDYTGIEEVAAAENAQPATFSIRPSETVVRAGQSVTLTFSAVGEWQIPVQLISASGQVVYQHSFLRNGQFPIPASIPAGQYFLRALSRGCQATARIVVQ